MTSQLIARLRRGLRSALAKRRRAGIFVAMGVLLAVACVQILGGDEPTATGGPAMVRRLTEAQYRASIADVFAPDIAIPARFEKPVRSGGLIAIGTGGSGMSPFAVEQYDAAAQAVAAAVLSPKRHGQFLPCSPRNQRTFDERCARRFLSDVGLKLFRRPLTDAEVLKYVDLSRLAQRQLGTFNAGLELSLYSLLVSPDFLFRIERAESVDGGETMRLDAFSKASRLSYFLTNSTPDGELLRAAREGELDGYWGLRRQVDRLMASQRFEGAVRAFFTDMLQFDRFGELSKDPAIYPAFNSTVAADAQEQTLRTIVDQLLTKNGDYRDLFTTRSTFLTRPLGIVYRTPVATRKGWEAVEFDMGAHRAGIQSHVSFLALHSHPGRSSPTLRGYSVREVFLCQNVPDPPANVNFAAVEENAHKKMSTARDRLVMHATEPSCAGCHKVMDPLGLTMEQYDGLGSFRTHENGARIDTAGDLDGSAFDTTDGLAQALHDHPEVPRCLAERLYKSAVGRDITWDERPYLDWLIAEFESSGYRVPSLMRSIAMSRNFFTVTASPLPRRQRELVVKPTGHGGRS